MCILVFVSLDPLYPPNVIPICYYNKYKIKGKLQQIEMPIPANNDAD